MQKGKKLQKEIKPIEQILPLIFFLQNPCFNTDNSIKEIFEGLWEGFPAKCINFIMIR